MTANIVPSIELPSSPTATLPPTPQTLSMARNAPEKRINGQTWTPIDHTANLRRGSKVSPIWEYGTEYINLLDP